MHSLGPPNSGRPNGRSNAVAVRSLRLKEGHREFLGHKCAFSDQILILLQKDQNDRYWSAPIDLFDAICAANGVIRYARRGRLSLAYRTIAAGVESGTIVPAASGVAIDISRMIARRRIAARHNAGGTTTMTMGKFEAGQSFVLTTEVTKDLTTNRMGREGADEIGRASCRERV